MSTSSKLPPVISILREALILQAKTITLFTPLLVFSLATSALLFSSTILSVAPLVSDLLRKAKTLVPPQPRPPIPADALPRLLADALVDVFAVACVHYAPFLGAFVASLLLLVAASYAFAMAYLGSSLSPQTLVARVVDRSYKAMVTRLYVLALSNGGEDEARWRREGFDAAVEGEAKAGIQQALWETVPTMRNPADSTCTAERETRPNPWANPLSKRKREPENRIFGFPFGYGCRV